MLRLALRELNADLVNCPRVLRSVVLAYYLLQSAVSLRFALDYFEFNDVGIARELHCQSIRPRLLTSSAVS